MRSRTRPRWARLFRVLFGVAGLTFVVLAFWTAWDSSRAALPSWPGLLAAFLAAAVALAAGARGWVALFDGRGSPRRLAHAFIGAQLGKYIPGGVWQVVGPVGLAAGPDVTVGRAATVLSVQILIHVVSGAAVGSLFALAGVGAPGWLRAASLAGLLLLPLLHRGWLRRAAARVAHWRRKEADPAVVPSQRAILRCFGWDVFALLLSGLGFALLLRSGSPGDPLLAATTAFSLAWVAGFLAVPFPAGLGVREAVLLAALGSGTALVLAASVAHRLVTIAAEALLGLATWRLS